MIDFIKIIYKEKNRIEEFITDVNNFEECYTVLERNSGEILYPYRVHLNKMDINISEKTAYIKNSIHKMLNYIEFGYAHNYDDFNYQRLCKAIDYIDNNILDSVKQGLTQLEFGLNIITDIPARTILEKNIVHHKLRTDNVNTNFKGKGRYKQFEHYEYFIKIYDKAKHYELDYNLLRFEIKYFGRKVLNKLGVIYLSDLKNKEILQNLFDDLIKRFDEMTIVDNITDVVSEEDKNEIQRFLSFNYWENLSDRKSRNLRAKQIKRFNDLLNQNDLLTTKNKLRKSLIDKFEILLQN